MNPGAERKTVRVTIFHQQYSVTAADGSDEIERLAGEVDELMVSIAQRAGNIDSTRIAVLAALHLADRLRSAQSELGELKSRVSEKAREYSLLLDKVT